MGNQIKGDKITMKLVRSRKEELQGDIELLEKGFEYRFSNISKKINDTTKLKKFIKNKPFISFAAATGLGLLIGLTRKKKKVRRRDISDTSSDSGLTSLIYGELKRVAARKAVTYISDLVDRKVTTYQDKSDKE